MSLHDQNIDVWCTVSRKKSIWPHPFENIISSDQQTSGSLSWNFLDPFITGWCHCTLSVFGRPVWSKTDFKDTFKCWGPGFINRTHCLREAVEEDCTDILTHYFNIFQEFLESMSLIHIIFWLGLWHIYEHMTCRQKYANLWRRFPKFTVNRIMKIFSESKSLHVQRNLWITVYYRCLVFTRVIFMLHWSVVSVDFYFFLMPDYCVLRYCK